jgi:hypothetical protein
MRTHPTALDAQLLKLFLKARMRSRGPAPSDTGSGITTSISMQRGKHRSGKRYMASIQVPQLTQSANLLPPNIRSGIHLRHSHELFDLLELALGIQTRIISRVAATTVHGCLDLSGSTRGSCTRLRRGIRRGGGRRACMRCTRDYRCRRSRGRRVDGRLPALLERVGMLCGAGRCVTERACCHVSLQGRIDARRGVAGEEQVGAGAGAVHGCLQSHGARASASGDFGTEGRAEFRQMSQNGNMLEKSRKKICDWLASAKVSDFGAPADAVGPTRQLVPVLSGFLFYAPLLLRPPHRLRTHLHLSSTFTMPVCQILLMLYSIQC